MRIGTGRRATTRRHILDAAAQRFRRDGVSAAGIAGIMGDAGLTNGGFYLHFGSKEELVREALREALADQRLRLEAALDAGLDLEGAIRSYLNRAHLEDSARGCPSAALLPEVARQPLATRRAYEDGLRDFIATLAALLLDGGTPAAERRTTALFALMAGTLQLARAVPDADHADQIISDGVSAALVVAGSPSIGV